jgi:putative ABC transport system permease protein
MTISARAQALLPAWPSSPLGANLPAADIYAPYSQGSSGFINTIRNAFFWTVRTTGDPLAMQTEVRRAVRASGKSIAFSNSRSMEQYFSGSMTARRFNMSLLMVFAVSALLVAGLGVYGMISYSVGRRTREFGLRIALGARRPDVLRLVIREGPLLTVTGCAAGLAGGDAASRLKLP